VLIPIQQLNVFLNVNESSSSNNRKNKSLPNSILKEIQELDNISEGSKKNKNDIPIDPIFMILQIRIS